MATGISDALLFGIVPEVEHPASIETKIAKNIARFMHRSFTPELAASPTLTLRNTRKSFTDFL
jgi:hypothetical protein